MCHRLRTRPHFSVVRGFMVSLQSARNTRNASLMKRSLVVMGRMGSAAERLLESGAGVPRRLVSDVSLKQRNYSQLSGISQ